jgi:hypothetical protein
VRCQYLLKSTDAAPGAKSGQYFFGRRVDSSVIADNVLARSITVLYGASGVGKSSVLNVGVPAALAEDRVAVSIILRRRWQDQSDLVAWLDSDVRQATQEAPKQPVVVVLDQFEEYFLYRTVNQPLSQSTPRRKAAANGRAGPEERHDVTSLQGLSNLLIIWLLRTLRHRRTQHIGTGP